MSMRKGFCIADLTQAQASCSAVAREHERSRPWLDIELFSCASDRNLSELPSQSDNNAHEGRPPFNPSTSTAKRMKRKLGLQLQSMHSRGRLCGHSAFKKGELQLVSVDNDSF